MFTSIPFFFFITTTLVLIGFSALPSSFGEEPMVESVLTSLNKVKVFAVDEGTVYYAELDPSESAATFERDTYLMKFENGEISKLYHEHWMSPLDIFIWRDSLYLIVISDDCTGTTFCNMGNIVRVPKDGGQLEILERNLEFKVDMAFDEDHIYYAEGNTRIWKMNPDGGEKIQLASDSGILSDMLVLNDYVYYVMSGERTALKRVNVSGEDMGQGKVEILAEELFYPYHLYASDDHVYWVEESEEAVRDELRETVRRVGVNDQEYRAEDVSEVTSLKVLAGGNVLQTDILMDDSFIFATDITEFPVNIEVTAVDDNTFVHDLPATDFEVLDMKLDQNSLYVLGFDGEYGIWRIDVGSVIPEFPFAVIVVSIGMAAFVLVSRFGKSRLMSNSSNY